jgi:hypothetical protein
MQINLHEVKILQIHNVRLEFVKKISRLLTNRNPAFLYKVLFARLCTCPLIVSIINDKKLTALFYFGNYSQKFDEKGPSPFCILFLVIDSLNRCKYEQCLGFVASVRQIVIITYKLTYMKAQDS